MQKFLLIVLVIAGSITSCKKEEIKCKGNCVSVKINGRAYDASTNKGFSNIPITVSWFASFTMGGFAPSPKLIFKGKTNKDGNFSFDINIDSSLFERNNLGVEVTVQSGYLQSNDGHLKESLFEYEPTGLQNIDFAMYPKANLTIRLHRV